MAAEFAPRRSLPLLAAGLALAALTACNRPSTPGMPASPGSPPENQRPSTTPSPSLPGSAASSSTGFQQRGIDRKQVLMVATKS